MEVLRYENRRRREQLTPFMERKTSECEGHDFSGEGQEFFLDCEICKGLHEFLETLNEKD